MELERKRLAQLYTFEILETEVGLNTFDELYKYAFKNRDGKLI